METALRSDCDRLLGAAFARVDRVHHAELRRLQVDRREPLSEALRGGDTDLKSFSR